MSDEASPPPEHDLDPAELEELRQDLQAFARRDAGWTRKMQDSYILGWLIGLGLTVKSAYDLLNKTSLRRRLGLENPYPMRRDR